MFSILFVDFMKEERTYDNKKPPVEVYLLHHVANAVGRIYSPLFALQEYIENRRERK